MISADRSLPACGLQQPVERIEDVAFESDDVGFVPAALTEAWTMLCVNAQIFAIEEVTKQHARLNVGTETFDEPEDCPNTPAAVNGIVDIRKDDVQLVRLTGRLSFWRSSYGIVRVV